jgi:hypothetical protein
VSSPQGFLLIGPEFTFRAFSFSSYLSFLAAMRLFGGMPVGT